MDAAPPLAAGFVVSPSDGRAGALVAFPFDRGVLERFRHSFPAAKFRAREERWFVPGKTAANRLEAWIARELAALDAHADAKGRDAYAFDPLQSPYLAVGDDLAVRTPFSREAVDLLRDIPFARFDGGDRAWHVPFRSYEALRARWPAIEAAAQAAEPEAVRARREALDPETLAAERCLAAERRRRRTPVAQDAPPPLDAPITAGPFGVVVIEGLDLDPIESDALPEPLVRLHPEILRRRGGAAWAWWRMPRWRELARLPDAPEPTAEDRARGWWPPTPAEIEERRRRLRQEFRARRRQAGVG